jgi:hypothetical protein
MIKQSVRLLLISIAFCWLGVPRLGLADESSSRPVLRNDLVEKGQFIHIPGPNPIIKPGPEGSWDEICTEASDAFKDFGSYCLYYHGFGKELNYATGKGTGYQLGVATSTHPLGPFKKYEGNPVLKVGPKGSWDDIHVACAMILKEGTDKYYMWYSGRGTAMEGSIWSIGLATASNPLGPWKKNQGNPIIEDFGYVGGVVKVNEKYYLYTAYPIGSTGVDYSPMSLAVADSPEGPWKKYPDNPVITQGQWGEWDDGGFSEAEVLYHSGVFHLFYGGTKLYAPRRLSRESIGYAYSFDGYNWVKYGLNPVVSRQACPNLACFAEVHAIFESPFIYLYHTTRYKNPLRPGEGDTYDGYKVDLKSYLYEDLGVQVIATQRPFSLDIPILNVSTLAPNSSTALKDCPAVNLSQTTRLALTARCTYSDKAKKGMRIRVRSGTDGMIYDTTDLYTFDNLFREGQTVQKTFELDSKVRFIKVMVENLDDSENVSDVQITATLGG